MTNTAWFVELIVGYHCNTHKSRAYRESATFPGVALSLSLTMTALASITLTGATEGGKSDMMNRFPPGSSLDRQMDPNAIGLGDLADITVTNDEPDSINQFDVSYSYSSYPSLLLDQTHYMYAVL